MYYEQKCIEMMKNTIYNSLKKEEKKKLCFIFIVTGKPYTRMGTTKIPQQTTKAKEKTRERNQSTRNLLGTRKN